LAASLEKLKGGKIIAEGTPQDITRVKRSYTGQYLRKILNPGKEERKADLMV